MKFLAHWRTWCNAANDNLWEWTVTVRKTCQIKQAKKQQEECAKGNCSSILLAFQDIWHSKLLTRLSKLILMANQHLLKYWWHCLMHILQPRTMRAAVARWKSAIGKAVRTYLCRKIAMLRKGLSSCSPFLLESFLLHTNCAPLGLSFLSQCVGKVISICHMVPYILILYSEVTLYSDWHNYEACKEII